jgi:DNA-binding CsgD family transcriptional regulator
MNLPAGLSDGNIELFNLEDESMTLSNGELKSFHLSSETQAWIQEDMNQNVSRVKVFSKYFKLSGYDLKVKWSKCRFGGLDSIPDIDVKSRQFNTDYHDCKERIMCPFSGEVCKLPEGPGGKLSHREIDILKALASGEPVKTAVDKLGVKYHTGRSYLKSVHKKTGAHSRADLMNFAYQNNII